MPEPVKTPEAPQAAAPGAGNEGTAEGKLDAILGHVRGLHAKHDSLCGRMDAIEAKVNGKPGEPAQAGAPAAATGEPAPATSIAADAGMPPGLKKDEPMKDEPKEATAMADSATAASLDTIRKEVAALGARIPAPVAEEDRKLFIAAQMRCEPVAQAFADSAPAPLSGETLTEYRTRLVNKFKPNSSRWKDVELSGMSGTLLDQVEAQIYADSMAAALNPASLPNGMLIEVKDTDRAGRTISKFRGDPEAVWGRFKAQPRLISNVTMRFGHGI